MMPGMAANPKIFDFISLPQNFIIHYLEWEIPDINESLKDYSSRFLNKIKGEKYSFNWSFIWWHSCSGDFKIY